jgi:hypothetical protein
MLDINLNFYPRKGVNNMIIITPLLDATSVTSTGISFWNIALSVVVPAITAGVITIASRLLDRRKDNAEERKIGAEEKKLLAEADKAKTEKDSIENEEWRKLYAETKTQYSNLKKESDEQIQALKKQSDEQMGFLKKQISMHSDTLEVQSANFETQEQTIQELKEELQTEKTARQKIEIALKKFQQWAIRNRAELEKNHMEPVPVEIYNY